MPMDALDRLLAELDTHVADAQGALAALDRARVGEQDPTGTASVSVWRPGKQASPSVHSDFDISLNGCTAHQRLAQETLASTIRDHLAKVTRTLLAISRLVSAGPNWRTLDAWPRLFIGINAGRSECLVSLVSMPPRNSLVMGATWDWDTRAFHTACRLAIDIQPRVGHGPSWTLRDSSGTHPSKERQAADAEAALALHALWGYPDVLGHAGDRISFVLSRVEENLPRTIALLRANMRDTTPLIAF